MWLQPHLDPTAATLTEEAVALFRHVTDMIDADPDALDRWEQEGGRRREYLDTDLALRRALGLNLWEPCVLSIDEDADAPPSHITHPQDIASWCKVQQLRRLLLRAAYGDEPDTA